jgi:hypothetical protein
MFGFKNCLLNRDGSAFRRGGRKDSCHERLQVFQRKSHSGRTGFAVFQAKDLPDLIRAVHNNCEAENTFLGRLRMLAFNRLRIDPGNGSPAVDYRIENGFVESRTLEKDATKRGGTLAIEKQWQRLTPEQLTSRVMADTVLLRWLRQRMGVYRVIRACNQDSSSPNNPALESSNRAVA